jgi:hypothetical protein
MTLQHNRVMEVSAERGDSVIELMRRTGLLLAKYDADDAAALQLLEDQRAAAAAASAAAAAVRGARSWGTSKSEKQMMAERSRVVKTVEGSWIVTDTRLEKFSREIVSCLLLFEKVYRSGARVCLRSPCLDCTAAIRVRM